MASVGKFRKYHMLHLNPIVKVLDAEARAATSKIMKSTANAFSAFASIVAMCAVAGVFLKHFIL